MGRITATFCISLPPEMAREIEAACRNEHRTRSELVREALRAYLRAAEMQPEFLREIAGPGQFRRPRSRPKTR